MRTSRLARFARFADGDPRVNRSTVGKLKITFTSKREIPMVNAFEVVTASEAAK